MITASPAEVRDFRFRTGCDRTSAVPNVISDYVGIDSPIEQWVRTALGVDPTLLVSTERDPEEPITD